MPARFNTETFVANARAVHGATYDYSAVSYKNQTTPVEITCPVHGAFMQKPVYHTLNAAGCPACGGNARLSTQKFIADAEAVHGELYDYSEVEVTTNTAPVKILCKTHGAFLQLPKLHRKGMGCPACGGTQKLSTDAVVARFRKVHGDTYDYTAVQYTNAQGAVAIGCATHGVFLQRAQLHWDGRGCPKCVKAAMGDAFRLPRYVVADRLHALGNGYTYDLSGYKNKDSTITVTCNKGHTFTQRVNDAYRHGCPVCARRHSQGEQELLDFVQGLCPDAVRTRKVIPPKELDVWVPSKRLAFEFNGLYWHSDANVSPSAHADKSAALHAAGGRLIHIWSDDWAERREATEAMIRAQLGMSAATGARTCRVVPVDTAAARAFLVRWHLQGYTQAEYVGLEDATGALVSIMGFSVAKSIRGNRDPALWELVRFAAAQRVQGGASKLLSYWKKQNTQWRTLITYCDLAQFSGALYLALGFRLTAVNKPDYKVIFAGGTTRVHKSAVKKDNLKKLLGAKFDPAKTEAQMCAENNIFRVWDCGKAKYTLKNDHPALTLSSTLHAVA